MQPRIHSGRSCRGFRVLVVMAMLVMLVMLPSMARHYSAGLEQLALQ